MFCNVAPRPRNAEATRAAILQAATHRFSRESYDDVGMRDIARGRTVIIISHRLAAVRDCHRIISVSEGCIVEDGTHAQLLAQADGPYARFWGAQTRTA